jgi:hypothetical protein
MGDPKLKLARRALLPTWPRILAWLCLVYLLVPVIILVCLWAPAFTCNAYGLSYSGPPFALLALLIGAVQFLHGVAAYGLLWGKSWGPGVGIAVCGLGLAISLCTFVERGFSDLGIAPFILAFTLVTLTRLRGRWATCPVDVTEVFA